MLSVKEINLLQAQNEGLKKQNAELQKENAELKAYYDVNEDFKKAWEELKAENERLKEEIKEVKKYQYQQEYLDKEIEEMQKALKTLAEGLNKRQMTLQEIKSIAESICKDDCPDLKNGYCIGLGECAFRARKQIIDLITKTESEVE